jgi:VanZ family protein
MRALISFNARFWPLLTALVLAAITVLSLTPLPEVPLPTFALSDKLHHLVAYALLAFPVALARPPGTALFLLLFVAWSGGIELVQPHVNRFGQWSDLAANSAGLVLGTLAAAALRRR